MTSAAGRLAPRHREAAGRKGAAISLQLYRLVLQPSIRAMASNTEAASAAW